MGNDEHPSRPAAVPASWIVAALLFLAPLKFGTVVETAGISFWPMSAAEWILTPWPPFLLPVLAGAALLLALVTVREGFATQRFRSGEWFPIGVWFAVVSGLLPGLIRTTEWDYAILFLFHVLGAVALALAVALLTDRVPGSRRLFLGALSAGVLWSAFGGWLQVPFGGLARSAAEIEAIVRARGGSVNPELLQRLHQNRAFSTFVYPNSFAAHLLLTIPLVALVCHRAGRYVEPARISRVMFAGTALVLGAGSIWFSGSRAALLAASAGVCVGVFQHPGFRRWRTAAAIAALAAGLLGATVLTMGRTGEKLGSVRSRLHYYSAAVRMFEHRPFTGVGLGEFYPWYLRLKPAGAEETRQPHNFFLGFASQAGILGAASAFLLLVLPFSLRYLWQKRGIACDSAALTAVEIGLAAWLVHALLDFDIQIPGTVTTAAVLPLLALTPRPAPAGSRDRSEDAALSARPGVPGRTASAVPWLLGLLLCLQTLRVPGERAYARLWNAASAPEAAGDTIERVARAAGRLLPLSPYPWALWGRFANAREQYVSAAEAWIEAAARTPHRSGFHTAAAKALLQVGRVDEAKVHARLAIEWYPTDPEARALASRLGLSLPR